MDLQNGESVDGEGTPATTSKNINREEVTSLSNTDTPGNDGTDLNSVERSRPDGAVLKTREGLG